MKSPWKPDYRGGAGREKGRGVEEEGCCGVKIQTAEA